MRIWDVPPRTLCDAHLLGEHREGHAVFAVIARGRAGYRKHPETVRWVGKLPALAGRHRRVVEEMRRRSFRHASPMRAQRGSRVQRARLLSLDAQAARLAAKPCQCPRATGSRTGAATRKGASR